MNILLNRASGYRPKFTMLVGVPGSGKSTYAANNSYTHTKHISSDAIRKELYGDENCQEDHNRVFTIMRERTIEALKGGYDVIYDATNISRKNRKSIMDLVPSYAIKECIIVWAPIEECILRDENRERTVGPAVIEKMLRRFEAPFYDEGFDYIGVYKTVCDLDEDDYYAKTMNSLHIPHDNPHHTLDVFEHCLECGDNLLDRQVPNVVKTAGMLHDIGKPFTKAFVNTKGEPTDTAHYYGHQGAGAWISYGFPGDDIVLAWLISTHMAPFINQKYYNSLDPLYKNWITELHNADRAAH